LRFFFFFLKRKRKFLFEFKMLHIGIEGGNKHETAKVGR
jgi:hypothetical protein